MQPFAPETGRALDHDVLPAVGPVRLDDVVFVSLERDGRLGPGHAPALLVDTDDIHLRMSRARRVVSIARIQHGASVR